jgi:hypothetical protein
MFCDSNFFFKKTKPMIFQILVFLGEIFFLVIFQILVEVFQNSSDFSNFG